MSFVVTYPIIMILKKCLNAKTFKTSLSQKYSQSVRLYSHNRSFTTISTTTVKRISIIRQKSTVYGPLQVKISTGNVVTKLMKILRSSTGEIVFLNHFLFTFGRNESHQKFRRKISRTVLGVLFPI